MSGCMSGPPRLDERRREFAGKNYGAVSYVVRHEFDHLTRLVGEDEAISAGVAAWCEIVARRLPESPIHPWALAKVYARWALSDLYRTLTGHRGRTRKAASRINARRRPLTVLGERLTDPADRIAEVDAADALAAAAARLAPRQRQAIELAHGLDGGGERTTAEAAAAMGLSLFGYKDQLKDARAKVRRYLSTQRGGYGE